MDTNVKYWGDSHIWEPCSVLCLLPGNLLQPLVQRWGDQPGNRISNFWSFSPHLSSGFQSFYVFSPRVSSGQQLWCSPSHSDQILASTLWSFWRDKHKSNCWRRTGRMFSPGIIGEKAFIIERCNGNGGQALCAEWRKSKWVNVENSFLFSSTLHCGWYEVQINFWKCSHTWRRRWSVCLQCMRSSCSPTDRPPWQNDDLDDNDNIYGGNVTVSHSHP